MRHNMKLNNKPYNSILYGKKNIEMRLYDEKRSKIKIGDIITFTNPETGNSFDVKVINLHKYKDFSYLYKLFNKERLGYEFDEEANYEDMYSYYSKEDISRYGVVGIEIKVIK